MVAPFDPWLRAAVIGSHFGGQPVADRNGAGNINQLVGDYTNPILKPEAAEVVKKHGEIMLSGTGYPDPRNQCHAARGALRLYEWRNAAAAAAGQDHDPL